jgi:hypothetical protein
MKSLYTNLKINFPGKVIVTALLCEVRPGRRLLVRRHYQRASPNAPRVV